MSLKKQMIMNDYASKEFREFLDKNGYHLDNSTPNHIRNEIIRVYLMEKSSTEDTTPKQPDIKIVYPDEKNYFEYDDDSFRY